MPTRLGPRILATTALGLAYVLASHWLMTRAPGWRWTVVIVLAPMLAIVAIGAWRGGQHVISVMAALVMTALCAGALLGMPISANAMYLAQHVGINLFLAAVFGGTLRAGRTALVSTLAKRVHRRFTPELATYTRHVTLAWTLYFVAMAMVSVALYVFAPFETWALFANLLTPLAVAAMFGGEYLLRYRLHPEFERTSVADAVRAFLHRAEAPALPRDPVA